MLVRAKYFMGVLALDSSIDNSNLRIVQSKYKNSIFCIFSTNFYKFLICILDGYNFSQRACLEGPGSRIEDRRAFGDQGA